jgi:hypothetical protein
MAGSPKFLLRETTVEATALPAWSTIETWAELKLAEGQVTDHRCDDGKRANGTNPGGGHATKGSVRLGREVNPPKMKMLLRSPAERSSPKSPLPIVARVG